MIKTKNVIKVSLLIAIIAIIAFASVSGPSIPYQDPTPEMEKKYNEMMRIYEPIAYISALAFVFSIGTFTIASIKLLSTKKLNNNNKE